MTGIGLTAWLALAAGLFCLGVLAAVVRRDRGGVPAGLVLMLAASAISLAAFVRYGVLPAAAVTVLLLVLVLGGVFVLVIETVTAPEEES